MRLARGRTRIALTIVALAAIGSGAVAALVWPAHPSGAGRRAASAPNVVATVSVPRSRSTVTPTDQQTAAPTPVGAGARRTPAPTRVGAGSSVTLPGTVATRSSSSAPSRPGIPAARATQAARDTGDAGAASDAGGASVTKLAFDPYVSSATISIPRLGLRAPVYERGIDATRHLPIAPGYAVTHFWYSGALGSPGNYVVYGHDDIEGNVFQDLPAARSGDRIYLDSGGRRYVYQVAARRIVLPSDVSVMAPTRAATLTLISCYPFNVDSHRIVVTATLTRVS